MAVAMVDYCHRSLASPAHRGPNREDIGTPLTKVKPGDAHLLDGGFGGRLGSIPPVWVVTTIIGEEIKCRSPLLYANSVGHRPPAILKIHKKSRDGRVKTHARCTHGATRDVHGACGSLCEALEVDSTMLCPIHPQFTPLFCAS